MMEEDNRLTIKQIVWATVDNFSWWLARAAVPITPIA
jgi:hypothetical protein